MTGTASKRGTRRVTTLLGVGLVALVVAAVALGSVIDVEALGRAWDRAVGDPTGVVVSCVAFGLAFVARAVAWRRVLPGLPFGQALAGIHLAFGANHVLPFRLGEPLRVVSVTRRTSIGLEAATASTVTLRAADIATVVGLGWLIAPRAFSRLVGGWGWLLVAAVLGAIAIPLTVGPQQDVLLLLSTLGIGVASTCVCRR